MLFEPPYQCKRLRLIGVFDDNDVVKIIYIIDSVNGNAG